MLNDTVKIKNLEIKNRLAVPPMVCFGWSDEKGFVSQNHLDHYRDYAKGGFGLIIVEATAIEETSRLAPSEMGLWNDDQIAGFKEMTKEIHDNGSKAFIQLVCAGGNSFDPKGSHKAPSAVEYFPGMFGKEMSKEEILSTEESFVKAALRAKEAGFDGVELHGCHGYLISCFFNSRKNKRTDEYGADRTLFAKEILQKVRKACGDDFIVGIRFGAFEPTLEDAIHHAKEIAPYTDFLDVAYGGDSDPFKPDDFYSSPAVYGAMCIKKELPEMPVFGVHMINSKEDALRALETGIDMVDAGRVSLVDPAFANHILNDEPAGKCMQCKNYCKWNPGTHEDPTKKCPGFEAFHR